jgi:hypothetical protein
MPVDFVGLSYEVQQLADPTFFSAQSSGLIREFKALSSTGVLRLGGNTSEFAYWKPAPDSPEPEHPQVREAEGEPKAHYYAVTDLEVELDFGRSVSGAVETEVLHAPALDSREAHITTSTKTDSLKQGKCSVTIPHATGLRLTLT